MNNKGSKSEAIAKSVEKISDSKGLVALGEGIGSGVVALAGALIFLALFLSYGFGEAARNWDGRLVPETKCFDIREISGELYKLNTCTGELEKVEHK